MMKTLARLFAVALTGWALLLRAGEQPAPDLTLRVAKRALSIGCGKKQLAIVEVRASSDELALKVIANAESGQTFKMTVPSASGFSFRQTLGNEGLGNSGYALFINFNGILTLRSGGFEDFTSTNGSAIRKNWEYIYELTPGTAYLLQEGFREAPQEKSATFFENKTYRANERKLVPENGERLAGSGLIFADFPIPSPLPRLVDAGTFKMCKLEKNRYFAAKIAGLPGKSFLVDFTPDAGILKIVFFNEKKIACQVEFNSSNQHFKAFFKGVFQGMAYSANMEEPEKGRGYIRAEMESNGKSGEFFFHLDPATHTFHLDKQLLSDSI